MKKVTAAVPIDVTTNMNLEKYDAQFPRYTSYPTAPHFTSEINGEIYANWLKNFPENEALSLYLHIPFCQQMCWYCGCFTKLTKRYAPVENYAHILAREICLVASQLPERSRGEKKRKVSHIHFGGGSPTILLPNDFEFLMKKIREEFFVEENAEIAIEIDPRNVNEEKIATYARNGVNRVSIGVQDFNLEVQKAINREQSFELVYDCVKLLRKYGISQINLDLVYGLPKQNLEMLKKNIDYALLFEPSRIALFSYAHVPWMKKHMRLIDENDLPKNSEKVLMFDEASKKLQLAGYELVGLDHFAKKDDALVVALKNKKLKRNFQGYSSDKANYIIGFGASAISFLADGYAQNILDFEQYEKNILAEKLPIAKGIKITADDKMRKKIIDEIMCYMEVDLDFFAAENFSQREIKMLSELENDGLVAVKKNVIKINKSTPQIARMVSSFFDKFFQHGAKKHSRIG